MAQSHVPAVKVENPMKAEGQPAEGGGDGMPQGVLYGCFAGSLLLIAGGVMLILFGGAGEDDIASVDPAAAFTSLGTSCTITEVHHVAESRREESSDGSGGSSTQELCRDTISYSFSKGGSGSYRTRESVSQRNTVDIGMSVTPVAPGGQAADDDRCTPGGGNDPYRGSVHVPRDGPPEECPNGPSSCTSDTPFVCFGECPIGESVACWEPVEAGFAADWANCGNPECIKLVDPQNEHAIALDDAESLTVYGIGLIILGVPVGLIALCCYCSPESRAARAAAQA
jgi:hypothetical protein